MSGSLARVPVSVIDIASPLSVEKADGFATARLFLQLCSDPAGFGAEAEDRGEQCPGVAVARHADGVTGAAGRLERYELVDPGGAGVRV